MQTLDDIIEIARGIGLQQGSGSGAYNERFRISLPKDSKGVFSIMAVTMSGDITNPTGDRTVHIDQYSGETLADIGWEDYNLAAKAMAAGIAFHKGNAGWWNLILAALVCVLIVLLSLTGAILWWKRRTPSTGLTLNYPPKQYGFSHTISSRAIISLIVVTGLLFPLTGGAMLAFLAIEWFGAKLRKMEEPYGVS